MIQYNPPFSINMYLYIFSQRYSTRPTQFLGALSTPETDQTYRERSLELTDCLNKVDQNISSTKCFSLV